MHDCSVRKTFVLAGVAALLASASSCAPDWRWCLLDGTCGDGKVAGNTFNSGTGGAFTEVLLSGRTFIEGQVVTTVTHSVDDLERNPVLVDFNGDGKVDPVVGYHQQQMGVIMADPHTFPENPTAQQLVRTVSFAHHELQHQHMATFPALPQNVHAHMATDPVYQRQQQAVHQALPIPDRPTFSAASADDAQYLAHESRTWGSEHFAAPPQAEHRARSWEAQEHRDRAVVLHQSGVAPNPALSASTSEHTRIATATQQWGPAPTLPRDLFR